MRKTLLLASLAASFTLVSTAALAKLEAKINLSRQTMTVSENGKQKHVWKISSGRSGYYTPTGRYRPTIVKRMHYSRKYNNSPMPYSVFFRGGYAIHGTKATWRLGNPASHGCIRLHTSNAKRFHDLVKKHGKRATAIKVVGRTPSRTRVRVASSTKVISLRSSKNRTRRLKKRKAYSSPKRASYIKRRKTKRNRYQAKTRNANSWNRYAASVRRNRASR